MTVKHGKREDLYRELVAAQKRYPQQEHEFTTRDFMNDTGLAFSTAKYHLQRMIERGELTKRKLNINGARTDLYSFVTDAGEKE